MSHRGFIAVLAALICITACSSRETRARWHPFVAVAGVIAGKPVALAAILLPVEVRLSGHDVHGWMQIDTGANTSVLYGGALHRIFGSEFRIAQDRLHLTRLRGTVYGRAFDLPSTFVAASLDEGDENREPVIGTLGADFFEHQVVALDLKRNRFALAASLENLPMAVPSLAPMTFVTKGNINRMVVAMHMQGQTFHVFYDSGSSAFNMVLLPKAWAAMTGRSSRNPQNVSATVPVWGHKDTMVGAPALGAVRLGSIVISRPIVYRDAGPGTAPFDGLFGNAAFAGKGTLIVDVPDSKFGFIPAH